MPVPEFHTLMSLPSKLELPILPFKAFMLTSWCFCLSVRPFPCLLQSAFVVFFSHTTSLFLSHNGEAGLARLEYSECPSGTGPLQYKVVMEKKLATASVTVPVALDKGTRGPGFVLCGNVDQ